jgi:phospholipase C
MTSRLRAAVVATASVAVLAFAGGTARTALPTSPCGIRARPPATYAHVIWIWMENRAYDDVVGSSSAPYVNALAAACGLATNYHAVSHPSLPNYLAATSGGTQGVADDGSPSQHPLRVASIFGQVRSASYEESMPANCALASAGDYAVKHNPEAYYLRDRAACLTRDLPLGTPTSGSLASALDSGRLPRFSFVTPNLCDDMHDCDTSTGDSWLKTWVTRITTSSVYRAGRTALVVTWDEDDGSSANHVATTVVAPSVIPGTRSARRFTHYSLLKTTEQLLGSRTFLGSAKTAPSMRAAFGL